MAISKKKIQEIKSISIFTDIIVKEEGGGCNIAGKHWTDCPPDMWEKDSVRTYDMMNALEVELKEKILEILEKK